ncbi:MonooxygenaseFAD-binding [Penicillium desertorum]|uniref:MonooxygenaseFAD-binding n=1 Tax=Penicillium desertorum TaxID=1303715 RepID=A0A9W9X4D1_9EURO|nr:MonooxygenaseFAD-binding [Penicillium desertorum]
MIGQPQVEEALLHQLDVPVAYKSCVTSIAEFDSGVVVTTDYGKTVVAKYAIAADGARSFVRTALDIPFRGTKPGMVWAVLDTFIETDFPCCPEIITFQKDGQCRVSWIPRERGMSRFYVLLDGEITQNKAKVSIQEHMAPHKIEFKNTEWFSSFEVKERVASTFVSRDGEGRIILAGDAAHVHAVNGGQGLNTGIADAFNLIWRIAFAAKGLGGAILLKSYDEERRMTAERVIDVAAKLVRSTVKTALEYVDRIEKSADYITGMGVSYPASSALVRASSYAEFVAGRRCPDLWVRTLPSTSLFINATEGSRPAFSLTEKRLYEIFDYGRFKIFFLGREPSLQCLEQGIEIQQKAEFWHVHAGGKRVTNLTHEFQGDWVDDKQATAVVMLNTTNKPIANMKHMSTGYTDAFMPAMVEFADDIWEYRNAGPGPNSYYVQNVNLSGDGYVPNYNESMPIVGREPLNALLIFASPFPLSEMVPSNKNDVYKVQPGYISGLDVINQSVVAFKPGVYYFTGKAYTILSPSVI